MTQAIEQQAKKPATIKAMLTSDRFHEALTQALPKHLTPDRFIRVALTAMTRTPLLTKCDQDSFFSALLTLSQLGIEPDGRRAHLIPFKNSKRNCYEVQLIIDYKGLCELAMRSGLVANIHADVIRENDVFDYDRGEVKAHKIDFRKPRGEMYAAYAICRFKDGTEKAEAMSREDIESIRKRSKAGNSGPWQTDYDEMAKKTVFRRLSKWLPLSPEYRDALEADADVIDVTPTGNHQTGRNGMQMVDLDALPEATPEAEESPADDEPATSEEPSISEEPTAEQSLGLDVASQLQQLMKRDGIKEADISRFFESKGQKKLAATEVPALPERVMENLTNPKVWKQVTELARGEEQSK